MTEDLLELSMSFLERFGKISYDLSKVKGRSDIDSTLVLSVEEENSLVGVWVFDQWEEIEKETIDRVLSFIPDTNLSAVIIIANRIKQSAREYGECKANIFLMERSDLVFAIDKSEQKEQQKTLKKSTRYC